MSSRDSAANRSPVRIVDHLVLIAIASLPLAAFTPSTPSQGLTPRSLTALGLSAAMLVLGYLLWLLPGVAVWGHRKWLEPLILPAFMTFALIYVLLAFLAYFQDPNATAMVVTAQLAALVYVSIRA